MQTQREKSKKRIVSLVRRNGLPLQTQTIADQLVLREDAVLIDLLAELVVDGWLIRGYTLLVNGDKEFTYNLLAV